MEVCHVGAGLAKNSSSTTGRSKFREQALAEPPLSVYYLLVFADDLQQVQEHDGLYNCFASAATVQVVTCGR